MNPLIPKARKPKFELILRIYDLNNVPLVTGTSYIKWHLPTSTAAEHRGRTPAHPIKEHKVDYSYTRLIPLRFTISKDNTLQPFPISFEVVQDYTSTSEGHALKPDKSAIGKIEVNLSEYVEEGEVGLGAEEADGEPGVVRRYLMQDSKINSTLKIGIGMRQVDGERGFVAPPLKTAPVFGGIAGIMAGEQEDGNTDAGHMAPTLNRTRDQGELQDMYCRALAASWAASSHELPADQCIEDIFAGGDGWKREKNPHAPRVIPEDSDDNIGGHYYKHTRLHSGASHKSQSTVTTKKASTHFGHKHSGSQTSLVETTGKSSEDALSSGDSERGRGGYRAAMEVDEFEMRDDLMSWRLPNKTPEAKA